MPVTRMLVVLGGFGDADEARRTVARAYEQAASPVGLRFALPKRLESALRTADESNAALPGKSLCFYGERSGLAAIPALLKEESYFLSLIGEHDFASMWDQTLLSRYGKVGSDALLTGSMGSANEDWEPQAYLPAFTRHFEENCVQIGRGLPLVCSASPVRTLVVDPALIFGRVELLNRMELRRETLSVAAYVAGVPVYALDVATMWPVSAVRMRWLERPTADVLPGTALSRFEQMAGFVNPQEHMAFRTAWGLYDAEDTYAQKLPAALRLSNQMRIAFARPDRPKTPHFISAFIDCDQRDKPVPVYMLRFGFLNNMRHLPLTLYTGGSCERYLRAVCVNARSYPDNSVLPKSYLQKRMSKADHMRRSKWLLLKKAARENPSYSHVAWINLDMLRHPICPDLLPDFSPLMDDRIHLATVNGEPDASFIVVPVHRLSLICRECEAMTQMDVELKRALTEEALIARLYDQYPDLFALHPMPRKHLLLHSVLDPRLVDARYRSLLAQAREVRMAPSVRIRMDGKEVNL
ncbi:MAG: hypothetical protein E7319_00075 [Clostridiales bacterium]|nr:hypothetical protein [Clostridiales bacterium]